MEFILSLIFIIILVILTYTIVTKNNPKKQSILALPGPRKLPIIGNLHQLVSRTTLPHRRLSDLSSTFGPVMHLTLGEVPTIILSSADAAKEAMKTHDSALCSRPRLRMAEVVFYGCSDIALAPYSEYWRHVRKIATLELFTGARVHSFRMVRVEEVMELIKCLSMKVGNVVNLSQMIFDLSFTITLRIAMNKKGKDEREFRTLFSDMTEIASGFSLGDLYPSIKLIHSITGMKRKLEDLVKRADKLMNPIIEEHISNMQRGENVVQDLIDILLTFHKGDCDSNRSTSDFSVTVDNIKAIVLELFGAGSETSSTTIEWAIAELLKNKGAMEKATDEVRHVLRGKEMFDDTSCLVELKYLKNVIKETLRLHPPFPLLVPRIAMERCQINGHEIAPNTRVFINAWAIGRDAENWKDPEKFNPERFEGSSVDYKGNHFELIPFGAGRRMCPGIGLGVATIELALAMLLYHFDWNLPRGTTHEDLDMGETFGAVARRKNELRVIPIAYSPPIFK
ncbi:hypothetical protein RND81_08G034600 [Saponaria officinalis]|uniref:Cytochrome P450 n=1 Tax=Saponaria officinalis TaxID=3572 RepID=A0AAW1J471_SAPOF